jgi:hypothetical protein
VFAESCFGVGVGVGFGVEIDRTQNILSSPNMGFVKGQLFGCRLQKNSVLV